MGIVINPEIIPVPNATPNATSSGVLCSPSPFAPLYIIKNVLIQSVEPIKTGYAMLILYVSKLCLRTHFLVA